MPQQALHYFGVVVVLPQQGRVGVPAILGPE
jgi:hypothetical protein